MNIALALDNSETLKGKADMFGAEMNTARLYSKRYIHEYDHLNNSLARAAE